MELVKVRKKRKRIWVITTSKKSAKIIDYLITIR